MDSKITTKENDDDNKKLMKIENLSILETTQSFLKLNKDTDLNNISENWFWKSQFINYFTKWTHKKQSDIFSSLKMADKYVDDNLIGDIDVITDAEIIKHLLKIPFNKSSQMSLMVHRIGNTLFIDDFDIHKYLLRIEKNEWDWLKKFYYETVLKALSIKQLTRQCKSREALQDRDLLLKFLCCSLGKDSVTELTKNTEFSTTKPSPTKTTEYLDEVFWKFDNIKMLIGSNCPIFGDETRPAVTLRLRDMRKPISILTGLDYWLDNLICNIPELHMCYHLDGIVQDYEVIRTEDIPYLAGSEFPPAAVKTIAKNILSFLKSNVTREGHTYWLFKGPGDEIVKLYDLTSLCDDQMTDKYDNAYTVPVAMLLYRVAKNMINNGGEEAKDVETISKLLKQCIEMLNKTKHPDAYSKACYLISDLYLKDNVYKQDLTSTNPPKQMNDNSGKNESTTATTSKKPVLTAKTPTLELGSLIGHPKSKKQHDEEKRDEERRDSEIIMTSESSIEEKAKFSIKYLTQGYEAFELGEESKKSEYTENFVKPEKVIPLNFTEKSSVEEKKMKVFKKSCSNKAMMLQKLISAYYCLAVNSSKNQNYGRVFKYMNIAIDLYFSRAKLWPFNENSNVLYYLVNLCGDCRLLISNKMSRCQEDFDKYLKEFNSPMDFYDQIVIGKTSSILNEDEGGNEDYLKIKNYFSIQNLNEKTIEENYFLTLDIYNYAFALLHENQEDKNEEEEEISMKKRLANLKNELGTYYLNSCSKLMKYDEEGLTLLENIERLLQKSHEYFIEGISGFEEIKDFPNSALLTANCAKLMRIYSKFYSEEFHAKLVSSSAAGQKNVKISLFNDLSSNYSKFDKVALIMKEKSCLLKAIEFYLKAIKYVEKTSRATFEVKMISNSIYWDLSSTCFNLACLLQDYVPSVLVLVSHDEIEKDITDYMNRAINYLRNITIEGNSEFTVNTIEYRLATIHHRLASLYHHSLRNSLNNETKKKHMKSLAEIHYSKAIQYYSCSRNYVCERLRILLEEVALSEFNYENLTSNSAKLKCLEGCLKLFHKCKECLEAIIIEMNNEDEYFRKEANKLTKIFIQRVQFILKNFIKLLTNKKSRNSNEQKLLDDIKLSYMKSLNQFDFKRYEEVKGDELITNFDVLFYKSLVQYLDNLNKILIF